MSDELKSKLLRRIDSTTIYLLVFLVTFLGASAVFQCMANATTHPGPDPERIAYTRSYDKAGNVTGSSVTVRPTDIDGKGHVNNARFVEYFQCGRWECLSLKGLDDTALSKAGIVLVVVNVTIDYKQECRYGETLIVTTDPDKAGEKSVTFRQQVLKPDGAVAADGAVTMVAIDPITRKSKPIPDAIVDALGLRRSIPTP